MGDLIAEERPWMDLPYSITITAPPLGGLVLRPDPLPPKPVLLEAEAVITEDLATLTAEEAEEVLAQPE